MWCDAQLGTLLNRCRLNSQTFPPNWLPLWAFPPPTHIHNTKIKHKRPPPPYSKPMSLTSTWSHCVTCPTPDLTPSFTYGHRVTLCQAHGRPAYLCVHTASRWSSRCFFCLWNSSTQSDNSPDQTVASHNIFAYEPWGLQLASLSKCQSFPKRGLDTRQQTNRIAGKQSMGSLIVTRTWSNGLKKGTHLFCSVFSRASNWSVNYLGLWKNIK